MKKWRNLLFVTLGLAFSVGFSSACASKQAVVVHAEGEETTSEVVVEEQPAKEENWFQKNYETYIVPLLSGVSITSILSTVVTFVFTIAKNKKLDQKVLAITEKANEKYQQAEEKLVEVKEILRVINEIYQLTLNNEEVNNETKTFLKEKVQHMITVIDENSEKVNKIDDLTQILILLTQLQVKVSKQSAEIVKSGIVDDINEITQLVKKL